MADDGTNPPPSTRSSSAMPEVARGGLMQLWPWQASEELHLHVAANSLTPEERKMAKTLLQGLFVVCRSIWDGSLIVIGTGNRGKMLRI